MRVGSEPVRRSAGGPRRLGGGGFRGGCARLGTGERSGAAESGNRRERTDDERVFHGPHNPTFGGSLTANFKHDTGANRPCCGAMRAGWRGGGSDRRAPLACAPMALLPLVSLVVPAYNEAPYIEACLRSLQQQDYPADRMEILVADGGSTDGTREVLARLAADDRRVRLIDNAADRIQARGQEPRHAAVGRRAHRCGRRARGLRPQLCLRARGRYSSARGPMRPEARHGRRRRRGFRRRSAQRCRARSAWAVRPIAPPTRRAGSTRSFPVPFGAPSCTRSACSTRARSPTRTRSSLSHPQGRRAHLPQQAGGRALLPRKSLSALAKQYFWYGDGRARTLLVHQGLPVVRPLIPFGCVMGGLYDARRAGASAVGAAWPWACTQRSRGWRRFGSGARWGHGRCRWSGPSSQRCMCRTASGCCGGSSDIPCARALRRFDRLNDAVHASAA